MAATLSPEQKAKALELGRKAQQLGFDFEALMRKPWEGPAPLHFTTEPFTVDELGAAWARYIEENGSFGCIPNSHMWHGVMETRNFGDWNPGVAGHSLSELAVDLGCKHYWRERCQCVRGGVTRVQCDECGFLHIGYREEGVVRWHDAHFPGWRVMPIPPEGCKDVTKWALANIPKHWHRPGAPIVTRRGPIGSRSVPGRSPWGGYDIASWWLRPGVIYDYDLAVAAGQIEPAATWREDLYEEGVGGWRDVPVRYLDDEPHDSGREDG